MSAGPASEAAPAEASARSARVALVVAGLLVACLFVGAMLAATGGRFVPQVVDLYVTAQYARAMAEGHPFAYNAGDLPTTGATSLLHTALLATAHAAGLRGEWLIAFAIATGVLFYLAAIVLAHDLAHRLAGPHAAALAGGLVAFGGPVTWGFLYGADVALFMLLNLWLLSAWLELWRGGSPGRFALAGSLVALTRPEGLPIAAMLALASLRSPALRVPRRAAAVFAPVLVALLPLALQLAFTGAALGTSVSGKALAPNFGWVDAMALGARYAVDVTRGLLLGFYPADAPIGFATGFGALSLPPLALVFVLLFVARPPADLAWPLRAWLLTVTAVVLVTGPNLFMGTQFHRYLLWAFPGLIVLAAAGLAAVTGERRGRALFDAAGSLWFGLGVLSTLFFVSLYARMAAGIAVREVPTAEWMARTLPPETPVANVATSLEYLSGHRNVSLHGVTDARFVGNRFVEKEAGLFESLTHLPANERPPYLLVARPVLEQSLLYQQLADGPPLYESPGLEDQLLVLRARWEIVDRGSRLYRPETLAITAGLQLVDTLNVCDQADEKAHGYAYESRSGALLLAGALRIDGYGPPVGDELVADGGRVILGSERFSVRTHGGRDLVVVMRSHGSAGARTMEFGAMATRTLPVSIPQAQLLLRSGGVVRAHLQLANGEHWSEHVFRVPAAGVAEGRTELQLTGRYAAFRYWFYQ